VNKFSQFAKKQDLRLDGDKVNIADIFNKTICVTGYRIMQSRAVKDKEVLQLQFLFPDDTSRKIIFTNSDVLMRQVKEYESYIPFEAKIIKTGSCYTFVQEDE
jgi:hypothetical protein